MNIQRTITILIENDPDLRKTLDAFRKVQHAPSEPCYNNGNPLHALALQRAMYHQAKGTLNAQMMISAIRTVAGAYQSAKSNKKPASRPFLFKKARALFLIGTRGRDADFRADGTLSIWTVAGRKRLTYTVPADFQATLTSALEIGSPNVIRVRLARIPLASDMGRKQVFLSWGLGNGVNHCLLTNVGIYDIAFHMDRTVIVQLNPTPEQEYALHCTMVQHTRCFNAVARLGLQLKCSNGVELHKQTYYDLRRQHPDLPAQLVCAARVKATEAVKSALDRQKKGRKVRTPHAQFCPIRYDQRSYWVKWDTMTCSLATVEGRMQLSFTVPAHAAKYIGGQVCSADLCFDKGRWSLHVVVSLPDPVVAPSGEVVGVDLGLNRPAVTSTKHFLGERRWKEQERRIFRLRRKLQAKGTKSAKRHLKKLSGKLFRQRKDHDHVLSKRIVHNTTPGSTIVVENLTHIRSRAKMKKHTETQRRLHSWSFAQFHSFLSYKAQERGIQVVKVDPRHTSQTCSRCGHQARNNRRSQSLFLCRQCGYCLNADLNAATNIRNKYVASLADFGTPLVGGCPVTAPIVSDLRV